MNKRVNKDNGVWLNSIGLENFQCFHGYQEIPLGEITFIYGPNSSGKSALIDAIEVLRDFWGNTVSEDIAPTPFEPFEIPEKLRRSVRREKNNYFIKEATRLVGVVSLTEAEFGSKLNHRNYIHYHRFFSDVFNINQLSSSNKKIDIRTEIRSSSSSIDNILLSVNGTPLLQYSHGFSINLNHPWISSSTIIHKNRSIGITQVLDQVGKPGNFFQFNDGWLSYTIHVHCLPNRAISLNDNFYHFIENAIEELPEDIQPKVDFDSTIDAFNRMARIYNELIGFFSKIFHEGLRIEKISGSRKIPSKKDLTYFLNASNSSIADSAHYGIEVNGDPLFLGLAKSSLIRYLKKSVSKFSSKEDKEYIEQIIRHSSTETLDQVNEALRDHLLLDRSYQIESKIHLLIDPKATLDEKEKNAIDLMGPYIVTLRLIDSSGNSFDFHDVGSGLGYMLPILTGINSQAISAIEQPELHLHPALQGALADVFIECCNRGSKSIIESHSEHLLLRALRRVRETSNEKIKSPTLSIRPEQLCVLYFDPSINGGTKVKRIRVSKEGDFLDYWPNGFFDERRKDLFDE